MQYDSFGGWRSSPLINVDNKQPTNERSLLFSKKLLASTAIAMRLDHLSGEKKEKKKKKEKPKKKKKKKKTSLSNQ